MSETELHTLEIVRKVERLTRIDTQIEEYLST